MSASVKMFSGKVIVKFRGVVENGIDCETTLAFKTDDDCPEGMMLSIAGRAIGTGMCEMAADPGAGDASVRAIFQRCGEAILEAGEVMETALDAIPKEKSH